MRKLTNKEQFDVLTCRYFMPTNKYRTRITKADEVAYADLSSRGIQPARHTKGIQNLLWGKTYRDMQITAWAEDVQAGLITKAEIYDSLPAWLRDWAKEKLLYVPYDIVGQTGRMLTTLYRDAA